MTKVRVVDGSGGGPRSRQRAFPTIRSVLLNNLVLQAEKTQHRKD